MATTHGLATIFNSRAGDDTAINNLQDLGGLEQLAVSIDFTILG